MIQLLLGDCLEQLKTLPDNSVDLVLTDPPYATTDAAWDKMLDFSKVWVELDRVCKSNTAVLLFGIEPFMSKVRISNLKNYRYDWIWQKDKASNFLFANKQPAKVTEYCAVFYKKQPKYYSQKTINPNGPSKRHLSKASPQSDGAKVLMKNMPAFGGGLGTTGRDYEPDKLLGKNLIYFAREQKNKFHPTQKPVSLCEHLIKAYTDPNDVVLDFTMGSGSTGVAAKNLGRSFIGIERDESYFAIAKKRIESTNLSNIEVKHVD